MEPVFLEGRGKETFKVYIHCLVNMLAHACVHCLVMYALPVPTDRCITNHSQLSSVI